LRKRLDGGAAAAGGAGGAENINQIVDPIERKLAVLDSVIKAINKQRALFASRVAGNLPLPKHTLEAISTGVTFGVPHPDQGLPPALPPSVTAKRRRQKALLKATKKGQRPMQQKKPVSLSPKRILVPDRTETTLQRPRSTSPVGGSELASGLRRETAEVKTSSRIVTLRNEPDRTGGEDLPEGVPDTTPGQFPGEADPEAPTELPQNDGGMDEEGPYRYHRQLRDGRHDYNPDRRLRAGEPDLSRPAADAPMETQSDGEEAHAPPDAVAADPESIGNRLPLTPEGYHTLMQQIYRFQCTEFQLLSFVDRLANSINLDIIDHDAAHETISELFASMKEPVRGEASRSFSRLRDLVVDAPWTRRKGKTFL
ncbi:hypothetical protein FOZ63_001489, partial [Perkinsus olseni]